MRNLIFVAIVIFGSLIGSVKMGLFDSTQVKLCKEAMNLNADQLKPGAEGRRKFLATCQTLGVQITVDQWHCVIAALKKGDSYRPALTQCQAANK